MIFKELTCCFREEMMILQFATYLMPLKKTQSKLYPGGRNQLYDSDQKTNLSCDTEHYLYLSRPFYKLPLKYIPEQRPAITLPKMCRNTRHLWRIFSPIILFPRTSMRLSLSLCFPSRSSRGVSPRAWHSVTL